MALKRADDWPERLHEAIQAQRRLPFAWGSHDCALFVADCIWAMTGTDLAADYRGKYTDEAGAAATIKQVTGGSTVEDVAIKAAKDHGLAEISPKLAQRGDMLLFDLAGGPTLAIVNLDGVHALAVSPKGLTRLRTLDAKRAWRTS
jgi:hypothetical protein